MRRTPLKIAVFVLTLGLGVGVSVGWQLYQWSLVPYEVDPIPPWPMASAAVASVSKTEQITIVGGMHACGPEANFHTMELSDGTSISQSNQRFPSRSAAKRALESKLVDAEIAERSPERDERGRVIGEKILIVSPRVMKLSISGRSLSVTDAPSLNHLRLYEAGAFQYSPVTSGNE